MRTYQEIMQTDCDWKNLTAAERLLVKYTELSVYAPQVQLLKEQGVPESILCACIYGLFQDYVITEATEQELYKIADFEDKISSPAQEWNEYEGDNLLSA